MNEGSHRTGKFDRIIAIVVRFACRSRPEVAHKSGVPIQSDRHAGQFMSFSRVIDQDRGDCLFRIRRARTGTKAAASRPIEAGSGTAAYR